MEADGAIEGEEREEREEVVEEIEEEMSEGGERQMDVRPHPLLSHSNPDMWNSKPAGETGKVCGGENFIARESHLQPLPPPSPSCESPPTWPRPS